MIQRDFILRLIEQLGAIVRALVNGESLDRATAFAAIDDACQQGIGFSFDALNRLAPEELLSRLQMGGALAPGRIALAGCIFASDAQLARDRSRAIASAQKALFLFNEIRGNTALCEDYSISRRVTEMTALLAEQPQD